VARRRFKRAQRIQWRQIRFSLRFCIHPSKKISFDAAQLLLFSVIKQV
jgi:hypothetical protein